MTLFVCTGSLMYFFWLHQIWLGFAAALFAHGTVGSFFVGVAPHELGHSTVFRRKWLNKFFLYLYSLLGWWDHIDYAASHTHHHRYTMYPEGDRENLFPLNPSLDPGLLLQLFTLNIFSQPGRNFGKGGLISTIFVTVKAAIGVQSIKKNPNQEWLQALHTDQPLSSLGLDNLRFYLGGESHISETLYLWLNHYLQRMELVVGDSVFSIPASQLKPVGFANDEALLPYPKNAYPGYRILQEFLSFPEAFRFVDIQGLKARLPAVQADEVSLRFHFSRILPPDAKIRAENFQLYCTPAINLFTHEADPVDLNGRQTEYRIAPSSRSPEHYEVFSIEQVEGWLEGRSGRGEPRLYTAFESFQHEVERDRGRTALYYRVKARESVRGDGFDHYISFVRGDESECLNRQEAVSLTLTCTNRQLPHQLAVGEICMATETTPAFASFSNITRPTHTLRPTLDGSLLWTLISNLSLNYLSLLDVDALRTVLRVYDFRALVDRQAERVSQKRLAGILDIETTPVDRMVRGLPVRGIRSVMRLDQQSFASEGDLYLFGTVLSQFFALYASINAFHQLEVVNTDNQERYTWTLQQGQQPLM